MPIDIWPIWPSVALTPDVVITESLAARRPGACSLERPRGKGGMGGKAWAAYGPPGAAMAGSTASPRSSCRTFRPSRTTARVAFSGTAVRWLSSRTQTLRVSPTKVLPDDGVAGGDVAGDGVADAGVAGDGQPYLVLVYVDGTRIDRWCDERKLDADARLALLSSMMLK